LSAGHTRELFVDTDTFDAAAAALVARLPAELLEDMSLFDFAYAPPVGWFALMLLSENHHCRVAGAEAELRERARALVVGVDECLVFTGLMPMNTAALQVQDEDPRYDATQEFGIVMSKVADYQHVSLVLPGTTWASLANQWITEHESDPRCDIAKLIHVLALFDEVARGARAVAGRRDHLRLRHGGSPPAPAFALVLAPPVPPPPSDAAPVDVAALDKQISALRDQIASKTTATEN
jgi:hypothetical protein